MTTKKQRQSGFTLPEMMVSIGCGSVVLAAVIVAGVSLQRSFAAVESYSVSQSDQLRVQDYIALDCRRAIGGSVSGLSNSTPAVDNGSWVKSGGTWSWVHKDSDPVTLILSVPNYYDSNGNAQAPQYISGSIQYGSSGGTTPISYYQSGTKFMRQVGPDPTATAPYGATAIATNIYNFTVVPPSQQIINANTVSYSITFSPIFTTKAYAATNASVKGTTLYANTFLRNPDARR